MRKKLLTVLAILFSLIALGQVKIDAENKIININTITDSADIIVDKGKFSLIIEGAKSYSIQKGAKYYDALSTQSLKATGTNLHGGLVR